MKYHFNIKDSGPDLEMVVTRGMLVLASFTTFLYGKEQLKWMNLLMAILLLAGALFIKPLVYKWRINKVVLLTTAALLLFIATGSVTFALILLLYGYLVKYLVVPPAIQFSMEGVTIKKLFMSPFHEWSEFSNIILKDSLLTLDFHNNKLLQLSIVEETRPVDEMAFNHFCHTRLQNITGKIIPAGA